MDDKEFEIERMRLRHAREKFWIGSVALVLLASIINYQIQQRELDLKQIEEENSHLAKFVEQIINEDPQIRIIIAEYFETVSQSDDARKRWGAYRTKADDWLEKEKAVDAARLKLAEEIRTLEAQLKELSDARARDEAIKKLAEANVKAAEAQKTIQAINPTRKVNQSCGAENQRPCKIWERIPSCDKGLAENFALGKCVTRK